MKDYDPKTLRALADELDGRVADAKRFIQQLEEEKKRSVPYAHIRLASWEAIHRELFLLVRKLRGRATRAEKAAREARGTDE